MAERCFRFGACSSSRGAVSEVSAVRDPVEALIVDLLEWIGSDGKPYHDVIDVWRTSCPRLPVWEEANSRGYLTRSHRPDGGARVAVSEIGFAYLRGRLADNIATSPQSPHCDSPGPLDAAATGSPRPPAVAAAAAQRYRGPSRS